MYAHITYSLAKIFIFSVTTIMNGSFMYRFLYMIIHLN